MQASKRIITVLIASTVGICLMAVVGQAQVVTPMTTQHRLSNTLDRLIARNRRLTCTRTSFGLLRTRQKPLLIATLTAIAIFGFIVPAIALSRLPYPLDANDSHDLHKQQLPVACRVEFTRTLLTSLSGCSNKLGLYPLVNRQKNDSH